MAASVERWRRPNIVRRIERVRRTGFIQPVNQALPSAAFQRDKRGEEGSDYISPASMSPASMRWADVSPASTTSSSPCPRCDGPTW